MKNRCRACHGEGLTGRRDQWGFGIPCPSCKGTGEALPKLLPTPSAEPSDDAATPRQLWGTCCPDDPECEHSFMDDEELARYLDTPLAEPSPNAARPSVDTTEGDGS